MTNDERILELSSLALAINEQTQQSATYAFDGKRNLFEILIYANQSMVSRMVIYYKKCKLEELAQIYDDCHQTLTDIITESTYGK